MLPPPSAERSPLRKITGNEDLRTESATKRLKVDTTTAATTTTVAPQLSLNYPEQIDIPSKSLIKSLFELAETSGNGDQKSLTDAGVLSLEEVLLPAVAYQEDQALRQLQAKAQRDGPPQAVACIETCRKAVFDCIRQARVAVAQNRQEHRRPAEQQREQQWAQDKQRREQAKQEQAQRAAVQQEQERDLRRQKRKNELVKKFPRNQEMWREVVYLMTEMSKLQKEERLWKEAKEKLLKEREEEIAAREQQKLQEEQDNKDVAVDKELEQQQEAPQDMQKVEQTVQDITLSTVRIQQALGIVSNIAKESDQVRKELYRRYRKDHQFHGYQGVKDPKGLLRALSQSQDVE